MVVMDAWDIVGYGSWNGAVAPVVCRAGEIKATFFMQVPAGETKSPLGDQSGDEKQSLKVNVSDGQLPQEQTLTFIVKQPGRVTFAIDCSNTPPPAKTRIDFIRLEK